MTQEPQPNWARAWIELLGKASVYTAVSLSSGAALWIAAQFTGQPLQISWWWFLMGCVLPIGPQYLMFTSSWYMRRQLAMLRKWKEDDLISEKEYVELRGRALHWYASRRFGTKEKPSRK